MSTRDPRIDTYIAKCAEFARPVLEELRERVHTACPDAEETLKWGAPAFTYRGKILAVMAGFKQHVAFNLWHGAQVMGAGEAGEGKPRDGKPRDGVPRDGMGQFGRLTRPDDLPGKREMTGYIRQAMALIEAGATARPKKAAAPKPPPTAPDDLVAALAGNARAKATFDAFPPGKQRDYVDWLLEAKRAETRQRRLLQAVEWMQEGKARHWKYESC